MSSDVETHLGNLETLTADLEQVVDVLIVASDLFATLPREFKQGQSLVDVAVTSLQNILAEERDEITMTQNCIKKLTPPASNESVQ